jgi:glutamate 5-kinase
VAILLDADLLVLLSDVDALYTKPPQEAGAERIEHVAYDDALEGVTIGATGLSGVGTGGALTKVSAARQAAERGTAVVLTATTLVADALRGQAVGTWFAPAPVAASDTMTFPVAASSTAAASRSAAAS